MRLSARLDQLGHSSVSGIPDCRSGALISVEDGRHAVEVNLFLRRLDAQVGRQRVRQAPRQYPGLPANREYGISSFCAQQSPWWARRRPRPEL
jgi:hypothetical protein